MSIAKKCDWCGKMYEQYNVKDSEANQNGIRLLNIDGRQQCFAHKLIDLCPDCMKQLQNWLKDSDMIATLPDNDIYDKCKTCQSKVKYQEENKALKDQIKQLAAEKQALDGKPTEGLNKPIDVMRDAFYASIEDSNNELRNEVKSLREQIAQVESANANYKQAYDDARNGVITIDGKRYKTGYADVTYQNGEPWAITYYAIEVE